MKDDIILDQHHVSRYCQSKCIDNNQLQATAFLPRVTENNLSVNWLEHLECDHREGEIIAIQKIYNAKLNVKAKERIAVINVGDTRRKVLSESLDNRSLLFLHDPEENDPSHSGIYNIKNDDIIIAELMLSTVTQDNIYPVKS